MGGDPDGVAFAINDAGQIAGSSGNCGPLNQALLVNFSPRHAILWDNGIPNDLGNLGGSNDSGQGFGTFALGINNQGQVVGASDLAGDMAFHAFLWTRQAGKMIDLQTLPGDFASSAVSLNDRGQVAGVSIGGTLRAFL